MAGAVNHPPGDFLWDKINQSEQVIAVKVYWRAPRDVVTSMSKEIMRLGHLLRLI